MKTFLRVGFAVLILALIALGVVLLLGPRRVLTRERVIAALEERFESRVELRTFDAFAVPSIGASGEGLAIYAKGRNDAAPLILIDKFTIDADLTGILRSTKRIQRVILTGLHINVPPKKEDDDEEIDEENTERRYPYVIEEVIADGAILTVLPKKANKQPLTFELHKLQLESVGPGQPMNFRGVLQNATPPGLIETSGRFGPWNEDEAGRTPLDGKYDFNRADLSVFKGVAGILSSTGTFQGVLERIDVEGETDTPDFRVSGRPVHLKTQFHAIVDGTDGDTLLQPVHAQFLDSRVTARGGVTSTPGVKGKTVSLDVHIDKARIEDLIALGVKMDKPLMTGDVAVKTKLVIPPGDRDVADKLQLKGAFQLDDASFTKAKVRAQLDALSRRSRGIKVEDFNEKDIVSDLKGRFALNNGTMTFDELTFQVPGATVNLTGRFGMRSEELDFRGNLRMQAKLSQTMTGVKSLLLKVVDPFFKKDGAGAVLPIKVTGTKDAPSFGLNLRDKKKK